MGVPFNFPDAPTVGQIFGSYKWDGEKWVGISGGVPDAPFDGTQYGRQQVSGSMAWTAVTSGNFTSDLPTTPAVRSSLNKMRDYVDIRDWNGIDLTGANGCADIVQDAITKTAAAGNVLHIPAGTIAIEKALWWPGASHIEGMGQAGREGLTANGKFSYFYFTHDKIGIQSTSETISDGGGSTNRSIRKMNFKRNQPAPRVGWEPGGFDFDVDVCGTYDAAIEDCMFLNPTRMIRIRGNADLKFGAGRVTLRNIKGQPIYYGIEIDNSYDGSFWDAIHLWPFWSFDDAHDSSVMKWSYANGEAFRIARADNVDMGRLFCFCYQLGMNLIQNPSNDSAYPGGAGTRNGCELLYSDGCATGILAQTNGGHMMINRFVQAGRYSGASAPPIAGVRVYGNDNQLTIQRSSVYRSTVGAYEIAGSNNLITIGEHDGFDLGGIEFNNNGAGNKLRLLTSPLTAAPTVYGGNAVIESPDWRASSSAVSQDAGSISAGCTIRFRRQGRSTAVQMRITVNSSTGGAFIEVQVPFPAGTTGSVMFGIKDSHGIPVTAQILGGSTRMIIKKIDNTYPGGGACSFLISGEYESP